MNFLKNIINSKFIINEAISDSGIDDRIKDAINRVRRVRIVYNDKKPHVISNRKGYKTRYILPVAYGLTKNGKRAIRAFQTTGSTKRGVPKWKLFLLDNIVSWTNSTRTFKRYKDDLIRLGLNTSGDKGMTTLFAITPFANSDVQVADTSLPISSKPISKNDITPTTSSQNSQEPKTSSLPLVNKTVPNIQNSPKTIDNAKLQPYISSVEAPETKPITKSDVGNDDTTNEPTTQNTTQQLEPTTEPVTKQDIENGESDVENVKSQFNDLMNRMDNLYKDEEKIE